MNHKLIPWMTSIVGSYAGWYVGARMGIMMAFLCSIVGCGIGVYFGRKWVAEHL
jgi:hypothetical protein